MSTGTIVAIVIAIAAILVALLMYMQKERTRKLRSKYGPEYDRLAKEFGSSKRAESDLEHREKRLQKIPIRALTEQERNKFGEAWRQEQARFVDNPATAVASADGLVTDLMKARGYPMGDFEQRAADISVDHPRVVENYRAAHAIASTQDASQPDTEALRKAMVHYRALFEDLLEERVTEHQEVRR